MVVCGGAATPAAAALGPVANLSGCRRFLASGTGPMYPRGHACAFRPADRPPCRLRCSGGHHCYGGHGTRRRARASGTSSWCEPRSDAARAGLPGLCLRQQWRAARTVLGGLVEYRRCAPEADGLREVYSEYDHRGGIRRRARRISAVAGRRRLESFPIIASALFDEHGTLAGLRIVTDPRAGAAQRPVPASQATAGALSARRLPAREVGIDSSTARTWRRGRRSGRCLGCS